MFRSFGGTYCFHLQVSAGIRTAGSPSPYCSYYTDYAVPAHVKTKYKKISFRMMQVFSIVACLQYFSNVCENVTPPHHTKCIHNCDVMYVLLFYESWQIYCSCATVACVSTHLSDFNIKQWKVRHKCLSCYVQPPAVSCLLACINQGNDCLVL